ncbi:hypothetical protein BDV38DRAFT_107090 [Aspergillus pseudotamarii]|uniref:Uncharacterized protein n=1 Tax=Aspergillus pseudotamarii TaxID=132259 RepID=A0A5N6SPP9_ASPPS|nr:uncharacterized protein BDV38DRAFT_107090 [Aspergillus pseudotamarii]KAE8136668.1 hypothetical protein BDV38DRAFT_107090 [Aspergillus pseudotamarii]
MGKFTENKPPQMWGVARNSRKRRATERKVKPPPSPRDRPRWLVRVILRGNLGEGLVRWGKLRSAPPRRAWKRVKAEGLWLSGLSHFNLTTTGWDVQGFSRTSPRSGDLLGIVSFFL